MIFGNWRMNSSDLTLTYVDPRDGHEYEVDLETFNTPAEVLDTIAQVSKKTWASVEDVGHLVRALDVGLGLQENLCGSGQSKSIQDVARVVRSRLA